MREVPPKQKAPGQLAVTFGEDEMPLHDLVKRINDDLGIPVSVVIKKALAATLTDDPDALAMLRQMKSFPSATAPVALRARVVA